MRKKGLKGLLNTALLVISICLSSFGSLLAAGKFGVVDIQRVQEALPESFKAKTQIDAQWRIALSEVGGERGEIDEEALKLEKDLAALGGKPTPSLQKRQKELELRVQALDQLALSTRSSLESGIKGWQLRIDDQTEKIVEAIREKRGLDVVFVKGQVVAFEPGSVVDITDEAVRAAMELARKEGISPASLEDTEAAIDTPSATPASPKKKKK